MKKINLLIAIAILTTSTAFAKGKIQNEDVKSLSDIQSATLTITGNLTISNACITSPSSTTNLGVGQFIYDTTTPARISSGTTIAGLPGTCSAGQIQMSTTAVSSATGDTITFGGQMSQLINDTKVYVTANSINQQLSSAISSGLIGGSGSGINYLSNPEFEQGATGNPPASWTLTTITGALNQSTIYLHTNSEALTYSSQTGGIAQSVTPATNYTNINLEASCKVYTTMTTIEVCGLVAGVKQNCQPVPATGSWQYVAAAFTAASGTVGVQVDTTASGTGTVYLDDCYVGPSRLDGISSGIDTPWVLDSGTWSYSSGFGTVTNNTVYTRRVGDSLEIQASGTAGSSTASFAAVTLPSNYVIDTSKAPTVTSPVGFFSGSTSGSSSIWSNVSAAVPFYDGSTNNTIYFTYITVSGQLNKSAANNFVTSSQSFFWYAKIPIKSFTDQTIYRPDATPANWSGYQDSISGGCATSSATYVDYSACTGIVTTQLTGINITCSQAASSLPGITCTLPRSGRYKVCAIGNIRGATNTVSVRLVDGSANSINKGTSATSDSSGDYRPYSLCGDYNASVAGSATFKLQGATDGGNSNITQGPASGSSAVNWSVLEQDAPMPAPLLTGSVTSTTSASEHIERASISNSGSCSVSSQSGSWISSVSHPTTGQCTLNFTSGEWSGTPTCVCTNTLVTGSVVGCLAYTGPTSSAVTIQTTQASSNTTFDVNFNLICMGPR